MVVNNDLEDEKNYVRHSISIEKSTVMKIVAVVACMCIDCCIIEVLSYHLCFWFVWFFHIPNAMPRS